MSGQRESGPAGPPPYSSEPRRRRWVRAFGSTLPEAAWFALTAHLADAVTAAWMVSRAGYFAERNTVYASFIVAPSWQNLAPVLTGEWQLVLFFAMCAAAWRARAWRAGRFRRAGTAALAFLGWAFGYLSFVAGAGVNVAVALHANPDALAVPLGLWAMWTAAVVAWFEKRHLLKTEAAAA